jgi:predicted glycoside hydrolase/deacetylase ChbG (UPF0249 family)
MHCFKIVLSLVLAVSVASAKEAKPDEGEIRLIVRGDDIGCAHDVNLAIIACYEKGVLSAAEVMVPCAWFEEAAKMLNKHPGIDVGIHLTLTSEWDNIKWRPLTHAPSLTNADGYFYQVTREDWGDWPPGTGFLDAKPDLKEVEQELRAQIELAMKKIKNVTHVSSHMGAATVTPELKEITERLAREYGLVCLGSGTPPVKGIGPDSPWDASASDRIDAFVKTLKALTPGTYMAVEHPGYATSELEGMGHPGYENVHTHRQGVTEIFTSSKVKEAIKEKGIKLIGYADLR